MSVGALTWCPESPSHPAPPPSPSLRIDAQARLVRQALEAALAQLKRQCPAVVCSRRERSLGRALPLLSKALAGVCLWG